MKIPVNVHDSWLRLTDAMCDAIGAVDHVWRFDERLIKFIEEHPCGTEGNPDVDLVYVPDEATDWMLCEKEDCYEYVIYVLDGKLYKASLWSCLDKQDLQIGMKRLRKWVHVTKDDISDIEFIPLL